MAKAALPKRIEELSPHERLAAMRRVKELQAGTLRVPERCGKCRSTSLTEDSEHPAHVLCVSCGTLTPRVDVKIMRQREIEATILSGPLEAR